MIIYSMAFLYTIYIMVYWFLYLYLFFGGVFGLEAFYSLRFSRIGIGVLVLYVFIRGLEAFYLIGLEAWFQVQMSQYFFQFGISIGFGFFQRYVVMVGGYYDCLFSRYFNGFHLFMVLWVVKKSNSIYHLSQEMMMQKGLSDVMTIVGINIHSFGVEFDKTVALIFIVLFVKGYFLSTSSGDLSLIQSVHQLDLRIK